MDRLRLPQIWSYNVPLVLFFYLILFFVSMTFIYSCLFLAPLGLRHSAETASGCSEPELLAVAVGASHCSGFSPGAQAFNARASEYASSVVLLGHVGSSWTRDWTHVPCIGRHIPIHCATRAVPSSTSDAGCCGINWRMAHKLFSVMSYIQETWSTLSLLFLLQIWWQCFIHMAISLGTLMRSFADKTWATN